MVNINAGAIIIKPIAVKRSLVSFQSLPMMERMAIVARAIAAWPLWEYSAIGCWP